MIDLDKLQDSFLLKWAEKFVNNSNNIWKDIPSMYFKKVGGVSAFFSDLVSSEFKGLELIENLFWKRVLTVWLDYKNFKKDEMYSIPSINSPIFNNSCITYKNKTIFSLRCIEKEMYYIRDFFKEGDIVTFREFNEIFNNAADSLLIYNVIFNALCRSRMHFINEIQNGAAPELVLFRDLEVGTIDRRRFFEVIRDKGIESVKVSWINAYSLNVNDPDIWNMARECCSETKLLELQWKILHDIYPTGVLLKKNANKK